MSLGRSARSPFPARTPTPTANRTRPQRPKKESRQTPSRGDCRIHAAKELSAAARSQLCKQSNRNEASRVYLRRSSPSSVTEFAGAYICLCYSARWLARAISTLTSREDRSKQGALSATAPTRARFRRRAPQGESARDPERPFGPARSPATPQVLPRTRMRLKRPSVHVARAIDRALSGEMVKTLTPAARGDGDGSVLCGNQTSGARRH